MTRADAASPDSADAAVAFARRLLDRERGDDQTDAGLARALEQSCLLITSGLSRWFGLYGSRALVTRALATAQKTHHSLAGIGVSETHCLVGVSASAEAHGSSVVAEGIVFTIAGLAALLGRLIGDELAITLLEQSTMTDGASRAPSSAPQESNDPTTTVKRDE